MHNNVLTKLTFGVVLLGGSVWVQAGGDASAGKEKATACAACHGEDGQAILGAYPNLAGQHADYLVAALRQYKSGARTNPIMGGFVLSLSDEDMRDIAAYYASKKGLNPLPKD